MDGRLESINASRGGVPKTSLFEGLVTEEGLDGDRQRDLRFHGGPDRALVLFSLDVIRALQAEGHPIAPGTTGENLTLSGIDWTLVVPGARMRIGGARVQITKYTSPCAKIGGSFVARHFMRISHDEHPGWSRVSARVLDGGLLRMGDPVTIE